MTFYYKRGKRDIKIEEERDSRDRHRPSLRMAPSPPFRVCVCVCVRICAFQTKTKQHKKRMDKNAEKADKQSVRPRGTGERQRERKGNKTLKQYRSYQNNKIHLIKAKSNGRSRELEISLERVCVPRQ